jgi:hypothetical protein
MQKPGDAYIQQPEGIDVPENVVFCWRDPDRVCGGDCVAFSPSHGTNCILVDAAKMLAQAVVNFVRNSATVPGTNVPPPKVGL